MKKLIALLAVMGMMFSSLSAQTTQRPDQKVLDQQVQDIIQQEQEIIANHQQEIKDLADAYLEFWFVVNEYPQAFAKLALKSIYETKKQALAKGNKNLSETDLSTNVLKEMQESGYAVTDLSDLELSETEKNEITQAEMKIVNSLNTAARSLTEKENEFFNNDNSGIKQTSKELVEEFLSEQAAKYLYKNGDMSPEELKQFAEFLQKFIVGNNK